MKVWYGTNDAQDLALVTMMTLGSVALVALLAREVILFIRNFTKKGR